MISVEKRKKLTSKRKIYFLGLSIFIAVVLILGVKSTYAYYHNKNDFKLLSGLVGDFDSGYSDINIIIYKENEQGEFTKSYLIPEMGYIFDDSLTSCSIPCSNVSENPNASCHYSYNSADGTPKAFTLTSNEKVTCKFYFKKETDADLKLFIMKEDNNGNDSYTGSNPIVKKYSIVDQVPAYGYEYSGNYRCEEDATLSYDASTRRFTIASRTKNVCYAYFNKTLEADAIVKVYIQSEKESEVYQESSTIPANKTYKLSENPKFKSRCFNDGGVETNAVPTYDGYININGLTEKQTCHVYLDIVQ